MPHSIVESEVEELALEILKKDLKYDILTRYRAGRSVTREKSYSDVVLIDRLAMQLIA